MGRLSRATRLAPPALFGMLLLATLTGGCGEAAGTSDPSGGGGAGATSSAGGSGGSSAGSAGSGAGTSGSGGTGASTGSGGTSGSAGESGTGGASPVDCSPIASHADWDLCTGGPTTCEVVYYDGAGCDAVCASVGLGCMSTYEDVDGACAPDLSRPALSCGTPSGHQSDYCVCGSATTCTPDCAGKVCGPDGCGGQCGACAATESCDQGACVADTGEDCTKYPFKASTLLAERVGFGRDTTGGNPSNVYHVTTLSDGGSGSLRAALESAEDYWIVFDVNGKIVHPTKVQVKSNKTVDGRGRDITIEGSLSMRDVRNVIITDVRVTNELEGHCTQAGDVITIQGNGGDDPDAFTSRDIWVHHVEAFNGGDGLLDIRGGSRITVSWTHFHTHKKGLLCWQDMNGQPTPGMRVTFHHNFFDRITLRGPQFVYGWAHYFNNYQFEWYEYGAASLGGAQFFSEKNVYQAREGAYCLPTPCPDPNPCGDNDTAVSKDALVHDWGSNGLGYVRSVGDRPLFAANIQENDPSKVFEPSTQYAYVAEDPTDALMVRIATESGPRVHYCSN